MNSALFALSVREALLQIRRGAAQAAHTVLALAVTLFCLGLFAAGMRFSDRALSLLRDDLRVVVYLEPGVDRVRADAMTLAIRSFPGVRGALFRDRDEAERRFRELMGPQTSDLFRFVGGNPLPESILVTVESSERAAETADRIRRDFPLNAAEVCYSADAYERVASFFALARAAGAALVACLLVVGIGSVVMAVALSVDARSEEIEIMRLVGATRAFIAAPYFVSACLLSLVSSTAAGGALLALRGALARFFAQKAPAIVPLLDGIPDPPLLLGLVLAGLLVAAGGSAVGLLRRLRA